jgi:hypothetical protein
MNVTGGRPRFLRPVGGGMCVRRLSCPVVWMAGRRMMVSGVVIHRQSSSMRGPALDGATWS